MAIFIYEITDHWGETFKINFLADSPQDAENTARDFPGMKTYRLIKGPITE